MQIAQIIGYILYGILLFLTITWAYGIRVRPIVYPTVLTSLYFLIASLAFSLSGINKIHLVWVIPLIYLSSFLNIVLIKIPTISMPLRIVCDIYTSIVRIGEKKENKGERERELKKEVTQILEERKSK